MTEWLRLSGMDFRIVPDVVRYRINGTEHTFPERMVLYRSDTGTPISVMSNGFKIVQPLQIMEFFRYLCEQLGYVIHTAGVLKGGAVYWTLAKIPDAEMHVMGDSSVTEAYVLLATSCDGSLATTGRLTTVRVVCKNTLQMSERYGSKTCVKVTHRSTFDSSAMQDKLGLAKETYEQSFARFRENMRKLVETPVNEQQAKAFFAELLRPKKQEMEAQNLRAESFQDLMEGATRLGNAKPATYGLPSKERAIRGFDDLVNTYHYGPGQAEIGGTAYGLLNGVSRWIDHGRGKDTDSREFSAMFGQGAEIKERAMEMALAL